MCSSVSQVENSINVKIEDHVCSININLDPLKKYFDDDEEMLDAISPWLSEIRSVADGFERHMITNTLESEICEEIKKKIEYLNMYCIGLLSTIDKYFERKANEQEKH